MKDRAALIRSLLLLLLPAGCITPYYPPDGVGEGGVLVINGFINASDNSVVVNLSRSVALSQYTSVPAEKNANVTITNSSGAVYQLSETAEGIYSASNMTLDVTAKYVLHVVTESGKSYSSDEVELLSAPILDSLSWRPEPEGVNLYVTAHNDEKNTGYYRWVFDETFEYNVPIWSDYKKVDLLPVFRSPEEWVYTCYATYPSTGVWVGSTKNLQSDVISMQQIHFLPKGTIKLSHHYRFTVRQYAITEAEFEFWQQIKKTTENVGGLFDPIPGSVLGNVHSNDDKNSTVLGYFSAGFVEEQMKYVRFLDLPGDLRVVDPYNFDCTGRALFLNQLTEIKQDEVWVQQFGTPVQGYTVAPQNCADCRSLFGGTNVKPDNWPLF